MKSSIPNPTVAWALLSWQGRLGRRSYFWAAALLVIGQIYLFVVAAGLDRGNEKDILLLGFGAIFLWILSGWALLAMSIKRLHDIGYSGSFAICIFIPFFSILFLFAMMVIPGSQRTNEHGPPPFAKE